MPNFTAHEAPAHSPDALPVAVRGKLVGRDPALKQVYGQLKINQPALVCGPAGIGKTALAATLASAYTELPGGVLWLPVNNSISLDELIVRVGRAYQVTEITRSDTPRGLVGAAASTLTAHKPLVVLDGQPNEAVAEFVRRCAEGLPIIVTSREPLDGPWTVVELGKLEAEPAVSLLKNLGAAGSDDDLDELASILDYTPLALAVAAGTMRLAKQSPADYLQAFEQIPASAGATPPLLALTVGFRALNNALQGIILMMGATFNGHASSELVSMVSGAAPETIQQVMNLLAECQFVERFLRYDAPHYRLHETTHNFAQTWLRGSGRLEMLQTKLRDALVDYVRKYGTAAAHDKLAAEMDNILAAARWSADHGDRDAINQLIVSLMQAGEFINERGYVYELLLLRKLGASSTTAFPAYPPPQIIPAAPPEEPPLGLLERAERRAVFQADAEDEEDAVEYAGDEDEAEFDEEFDKDLEAPAAPFAAQRPEDAILEGVLPAAPPELSEPGRLQTALRLARQQGDLAQQVELLTRLAELHVQAGHDTEAISAYSELVTAYEALDDREGLLRTLDTLSALMVKTENSGAAVMHATRGINLTQDLDDAETRMNLLMTLGDARQQLGDSAEAARAYSQALEIARNQGDSQNEAIILFKLGHAQLDNSDPETAAANWEQALALFKAQGKRDYEGRVLGGLGTAYGDLGRWTEAINFHTSALHIAREVKDQREEALQLSNLGYAAVEANQLGQAVLRYRQALHLALLTDNRENIVSNIVDLVRLLVESRRHLAIAEMLINHALELEPADRDVIRLKDRVTSEKGLALADGVQLIPVAGTIQEYAANAYAQLEG